MAKRDPNKTARNRIIGNLKVRLRELVEEVLAVTGFENETVLNATIGSKNDEFFDLKHDVIPNDMAFVQTWLEGIKESATNDGSSRWKMWMCLKKHSSF